MTTTTKHELTPKQEAFCQAIVSGVTQADAYRKAYSTEKMKPATIQSKASILMAQGKIRARVEQLRKPIVEKLLYTVEHAMAEAGDALKVATKNENPAAMVAAVTLRARLNGHLVDKREIRTAAIEELPDEALDALIRRKATEAGVTLQ